MKIVTTTMSSIIRYCCYHYSTTSLISLSAASSTDKLWNSPLSKSTIY